MRSEIPLPFPIPTPSGIVYNVSSFALFLMIAFLLGAILSPRELRRRGLNSAVSDWVIILADFGTLIGAKIGYVFEIWDRIWIVTDSFSDTLYHLIMFQNGMGQKVADAVGLWQALLSQGGLVFYGGLLFSIGLIYLFLKFKKLPVWRYADVFFMMLTLGYGVGRLGCMVSGDGCYGYSSNIDLPILTMVFGPASIIPTDGVRVWNTSLIEAVFSWLLFGWIMLVGRYRAYRPGFFGALFLIYDGLVRFLVEFLRINDAVIPILPHPQIAGVPLLHHNSWLANPEAYYFENWHWYGFTQSQIVGFIFVIVGFSLILIKGLYKQDDLDFVAFKEVQD